MVNLFIAEAVLRYPDGQYRLGGKAGSPHSAALSRTSLRLARFTRRSNSPYFGGLLLRQKKSPPTLRGASLF